MFLPAFLSPGCRGGLVGHFVVCPLPTDNNISYTVTRYSEDPGRTDYLEGQMFINLTPDKVW